MLVVAPFGAAWKLVATGLVGLVLMLAPTAMLRS
jgi:hypothetical protein